MFSTALLLVTPFFAVEIFAVDVTCATKYKGDPIENCCDLGYRELTFSGVVNNHNIYHFKNFCNKNCTAYTTYGYCDTTTDGGGWLVIQRMNSGAENFHRVWNDYEKGFGHLLGQLWYGLRALHCLTQHGKWELRIEFSFNNGTRTFMHYNHFKVGPASDNYRLSISGFTGITPTDPFATHPLNGQQFSTRDRDNDKDRQHCALKSQGNTEPGGWWYNSCFHINLNFKYGVPNIFLAGKWYKTQRIDMKIRPVNCEI